MKSWKAEKNDERVELAIEKLKMITSTMVKDSIENRERGESSVEFWERKSVKIDSQWLETGELRNKVKTERENPYRVQKERAEQWYAYQLSVVFIVYEIWSVYWFVLSVSFASSFLGADFCYDHLRLLMFLMVWIFRLNKLRPVMKIRETPVLPGTGVMKEATFLAWWKSTSPTSLWPLFLVASGMALIPQSITTAPGLIQSPGLRTEKK